MFQVAKTLLCYPEQSIPTVFGLTAAELMNLNHESSLNIERYPIPTTRKSAQIARSLSTTNQLAQPFVPTGDSLLWDIVCNVQIQPDCSITHSRYKPSELPEEIGDRFQQLPQELQRNYIRHQLREQVYDEERSHFRPETPLFTKRLAPGLGLAEEPEIDPKDFGLNRCQVIADALLAVWETGDDSPGARWMGILEQHFTQHGIDLQRPYLNPNAEDIYTPLL